MNNINNIKQIIKGVFFFFWRKKNYTLYILIDNIIKFL